MVGEKGLSGDIPLKETKPMDQLIEKIIQNPHFLGLKTIVENNPYHNQEPVYDHLLKTLKIAQDNIDGGFITDPEAQRRYQDFIHEDVGGMQKGDVMVLTALLHDIGKSLQVKDGDTVQPLIVTKPDGTTACPNHEYWGSTIIRDVISGLELPEEVIVQIENVIRLHDTFNQDYFAGKTSWDFSLLMNDVKSRADGWYKEALFNIYCDNYTAPIYSESKERLVSVFNSPQLYTPRQYITP